MAASPAHPHSGNNAPAAVIGPAHPVIPKGGNAIRMDANPYRAMRCHPGFDVQSRVCTNTKLAEAANQSPALSIRPIPR